MKHILQMLLGCLLICTGIAVQAQTANDMKLRVMTFNIRYANPNDGPNVWSNRKEVAAEVIKQNQVDVVGTQEVLNEQLKDLLNRLPNYKHIGVGREDGKKKGEYSAILYRTDRFKVNKSGTFWLSETPEVAGSKGWDGACERVATWAILTERSTGRDFFFINTHLDHVGREARKEGVQLILSRIKQLSNGLPVVLTGDFNSSPTAEPIQLVLTQSTLRDSRTCSVSVKGNEGTFHSFGEIRPDRRNRIDYIFVSPKIQVNSYEVIPDKLNDVIISDHSPVMVDLTIP